MEKETWKTSIAQIKKGEIRIRGYDITELMEKLTFSQVIFLILKGELPNSKESKMMEAILVSSIDHGATPPSSLATRTVISGGNPLNAAVAGGVLTIGDFHGGAIEECAKMFQQLSKKDGELSSLSSELVKDYSARKKRIPGYGHRLHETDPRTVKLFKIAEKLGFSGKHLRLAQEIEKKLEETSGRKLPLNVDGAIAAVVSDMGFDWRLGKGFFIISRVPGLVAHAYEELTREKPMRRLGNTDFEYDGPKPREVP